MLHRLPKVCIKDEFVIVCHFIPSNYPLNRMNHPLPWPPQGHDDVSSAMCIMRNKYVSGSYISLLRLMSLFLPSRMIQQRPEHRENFSLSEKKRRTINSAKLIVLFSYSLHWFTRHLFSFKAAEAALPPAFPQLVALAGAAACPWSSCPWSPLSLVLPLPSII